MYKTSKFFRRKTFVGVLYFKCKSFALIQSAVPIIMHCNIRTSRYCIASLINVCQVFCLFVLGLYNKTADRADGEMETQHSKARGRELK